MKIISDRLCLTGLRKIEWIKHSHHGDANSILCKTKYSAISTGTELAAYTGMPSLSGQKIYPRVNGYMNVAQILDVGKSVRNFAPGDYVLTFNCHESHFIQKEEDVLLKLNDSKSHTSSVFAYAYHLGYSALLKSRLPVGANVAVIGQGLVGQATAEFLAQSGYPTTAISDHFQGGDISKTLANISYANRLQNFDTNFDLIIVTTGSWRDYAFGLKNVARNGVISILGFPGRDGQLPDFNPFMSEEFYQKQITIQASGLSPEINDSRGFNRFNERTNLSFISNLIDNGILDPTRFASIVGPNDQIEEFYKCLEKRSKNEISAIITW